MLDFIRICLLGFICLHCIFRVTEIDFRITWWQEIVSYILTGIGSFWAIMAFYHLIIIGEDSEANEDMAAIIFLLGVSIRIYHATSAVEKRKSHNCENFAPRRNPWKQ
jgi:hypothetical protein